MKKNVLLSILFFATIGMYSCSDNALDDVDHHVSDIQNQPNEQRMNEEDADADPQWQALQQYDRLMSNFQSVPIGPGDVDLPFPGYYGGAYINDDNKLVVQVKGNSEKLKRKIYDLVGSEDIVIQRAKHSMGSLNRIMNGLNEYKRNHPNEASSANWNRFAISETNNEVVVGMLELNDGRIKEFRKSVMNHPAIRFESSQPIVRTAVFVDPGCAISAYPTESKDTASSLAFRAMLADGTEGVVGSGHAFNLGNIAYYNAESIGRVTDKEDSGEVDAAFITIDDPSYYIPGNLLCNTSTFLSTATSRPGEGTVVNMRGQYTGLNTGKIINTNASFTYANGALCSM
ncbi:MAG: hypothetical protein WBB45_03550 [Cyclobacteriaceae bacterium]